MCQITVATIKQGQRGHTSAEVPNHWEGRDVKSQLLIQTRTRMTYPSTTLKQRLLVGPRLEVEREGDVSDLHCDCKNVGKGKDIWAIVHKRHYRLSGGGETRRCVRLWLQLQNEGRDNVCCKYTNKPTGDGEEAQCIRLWVQLQRVGTTYVGQSATSSSSQSVLEVGK